MSSSLISPALEQFQDLPAGDRALLAGKCPGLLGAWRWCPIPETRAACGTLTSLLLTATAAVLEGGAVGHRDRRVGRGRAAVGPGLAGGVL